MHGQPHIRNRFRTCRFSSAKGRVKDRVIPVKCLTVPDFWGSQISRQSPHEDGKFVSPTHRPPLPPQEILLVLISVRVWVEPRTTVRPERLYRWKIRNTASGIEPATFRLVAQCLNQLGHRMTPKNKVHYRSFWWSRFESSNLFSSCLSSIDSVNRKGQNMMNGNKMYEESELFVPIFFRSISRLLY